MDDGSSNEETSLTESDETFREHMMIKVNSYKRESNQKNEKIEMLVNVRRDVIKERTKHFQFLQMKQHVPKFTNAMKKFERMLMTNRCKDGGKTYTMQELNDEKVAEIKVCDGWSLDRVIAIEAGMSTTMRKRLGILMTQLWSPDEMKNLVMRKMRFPKGTRKRQITEEELRKLMGELY